MPAELDYIAAALTIVYGERPATVGTEDTCGNAWRQYDDLRIKFVQKHRTLERLKRLVGIEAPHLLDR